MLSKLVLIIDKRKELPAKYKKIIENSKVNVILAPVFETALNYLTEYEPDAILISDSIDLPVSDAIKKIRMLSYPSRPCIIALSKSSELQDKLDVLDSGADDFLSEPIDSDEFKARINAHLRRHFEGSIEEITQLPDLKASLKVFKRTIVENKKWAAMLIKANNLEAYREIYGDLAADKMLQTVTAIMNSTIDENDFLGQLTNGEFLILSSPHKIERIASFLVYAFDSIVEKFYNEEDAKQGYIVLYGDDNAGKRINLVFASIGIISSEYQVYANVNTAMTALFSISKLAKSKQHSTYVVERTKISAENAIAKKEINNKILIVESDEALRFLLKTTAEMQGYEVSTTDDYSRVIQLVKSFNPALIILDAGSTDNLEGIDLCTKIKKDENLKNTKIIISTIIHDKKLVLNTGADLYLPKPYELLSAFNWIEYLIKEYND